MVPTLAAADFITRYIPPQLAPVNWGLGFFLIAVCECPLPKPKYLSTALNAFLLVCVPFPLWDAKGIDQTDAVHKHTARPVH
jgi:hypothetical protein